MSHELFEIGNKVKYYPVLSNKNIFSEHEITSRAWDVCGTTVIKVSGKGGGVSVDHLELLSK